MKNTYKKVKLIEIAELNSRQIDKNFTYKYIQYIDVSSVTKGSINNIQYLKTTEAPSRAKRLVEKNDILYSTVRPNLEHYVFIKEDVETNTVASTGFVVITPKKGFVDPYYLHCLITRPQYTQYLSQIAEQAVSTYPTITPNVMADLELTLPPLSEQKRIANILSSFDNKIEILKKENKILEDIAEDIFKEWFIKYNFPNKDGRPYKDNGGMMIDSELGPIPEGWRVGKLGDFGQVICGKTPSTKNSSFFGGNYPFIKIPDMTELYVFKTESTLTDLGSKELNDKIVPANSICVSCIATIGKVSITTEDSFTNQQINTIIPNQNIYREYLYFTLNNMQEYLEMIGNRGSTTFNINTEMFRNLEIVTPKEELLGSFSSATANLFEKILVNTKLTMNLEIQKDKLLKELVK